MNTFRMVPQIAEYQEFADFAKDAALGAEDLIFTSEHFYESDLKALKLECQYLFRSRYGGGEPTDVMVNAILADLEKLTFDRIIAVGGGAIIDMAKILAVAEKGERVDALYERMADLKQLHPLIAVPTTCGTGSEVTNISIVNRTSKGIKQGIVSPAMYPEQAVLIPDLLGSLPYKAFATSSIDAMVHSIESYLSPRATVFSKLFSEQALDFILPCWKKAAACGELEGWKHYATEFLRASTYAGIAFGNAGCAAVHALSYPLGGEYHVPHGEANQIMFAPVLKKYAEKNPGGRLGDLSVMLAKILNCPADTALNELYELMDRILVRKPMQAYGVKKEELVPFADNVIATQQRLLGNNYVELSRADIIDIYEHAF